MNNKYNKLINNSILFAIGNFGSKFITFFMLPLYTYQLSQADYGITDLIQTTVSLLLPIISMSIFDAVLRFAMDKKFDWKEVFSVGLSITNLTNVILMIFGIGFLMFDVTYYFYVVIILIIQSYQILFSQFIKAIDKVRLYAINGIFLSFATAFFNILFLLVFNMGISGYILALFSANLVSNIYMFIGGDLRKYIDFSKVNKTLLKKMIQFSTPLIPNSIAWWATNTISRYFILFFLGAASNGIFAVANKIPNLLSVVNSIFFQSWQMSAIEESESDGKEIFYSNVYSMYYQFLFISTSGILLILKPLVKIVVAPSFYISWMFVPLLLLSVLYSSLSGFFGQFYIAAKKTSGLFTTTILGAIINISLNVILIPLLGLQGAALSSVISFLVIWLLRVKDTQKLVKISFNRINIVLNHLFLFIQMGSLYLLDGLILYIIQILIFLILLVVNRGMMKIIIKRLIRR